MEINKVVAALDSNIRREMLRILSKDPMNVVEVLEELKRRKFEVKYRETVYRGLEKLLEAGLVDKSYVKNKGLCYKLTANRIIIDVTKDSIEKF